MMGFARIDGVDGAFSGGGPGWLVDFRAVTHISYADTARKWQEKS